MVLVQRFCCCASLQTGAIVAAVISTCVASISLLSGLDSFITAEHHYTLKHPDPDYTGTDPYTNGVKNVLHAVVIFIIVAFLCVGIHQRNARFILPWLIYTVVCIVVAFIYFVISAHSMGAPFEDSKPAAFTFYILFAVIILIFWIYIFIVIFSYYQSLKPSQITETVITITKSAEVTKPTTRFLPTMTYSANESNLPPPQIQRHQQKSITPPPPPSPASTLKPDISEQQDPENETNEEV